MDFSALPAWEDYCQNNNDGPPLSTEEYLAQITEEAEREEEEEFNQMSRHERDRYLKTKADASAHRACQRLKKLRLERRDLIRSALLKPILMPASLIGAGIAALVAQGNIGPIVAGTGVAVDIGLVAYWLRNTIARWPVLSREIKQQEETIREYQNRYSWEARILLSEENIDVW